MRDLGQGPVRSSDAASARAVADGLHVLQDRGLGLVLPADGAGRLQPLHRRLEAVHGDGTEDVTELLDRGDREATGVERVRGPSSASAAVGQRSVLTSRRSCGVPGASTRWGTPGARPTIR